MEVTVVTNYEKIYDQSPRVLCYLNFCWGLWGLFQPRRNNWCSLQVMFPFPSEKSSVVHEGYLRFSLARSQEEGNYLKSKRKSWHFSMICLIPVGQTHDLIWSSTAVLKFPRHLKTTIRYMFMAIRLFVTKWCIFFRVKAVFGINHFNSLKNLATMHSHFVLLTLILTLMVNTASSRSVPRPPPKRQTICCFT